MAVQHSTPPAFHHADGLSRAVACRIAHVALCMRNSRQQPSAAANLSPLQHHLHSPPQSPRCRRRHRSCMHADPPHHRHACRQRPDPSPPPDTAAWQLAVVHRARAGLAQPRCQLEPSTSCTAPALASLPPPPLHARLVIITMHACQRRLRITRRRRSSRAARWGRTAACRRAPRTGLAQRRRRLQPGRCSRRP